MMQIDPFKIIREQAMGAFVGALLLPVIIFTGFIVLLFILAFTHLLGGPYGIAKLLFWFLAFIYTSVGCLIVKIVKQGRKISDKVESEATQVFRDAEIIDKK